MKKTTSCCCCCCCCNGKTCVSITEIGMWLFVNVPLFVHPSFNFLSLLLLYSMSQVSGPTQLCRGESGSQHHTYGQFRSAGSLKCMSQLRLRQDVADLQPTFRCGVQPSRHSQFLSSSSAVKPAFCCRVCCCEDDGNSAWCCQTCLKSLWCSRLLTHCQSTRFVYNLIRTGTYNHFNQCDKLFIPKVKLNVHVQRDPLNMFNHCQF